MAKRVGGRGSAPDPAGGNHDAPQTSPRSAPSALRFLRLRRSILGAFGASNFAPSALNFGVPIVVNLRIDHCNTSTQNSYVKLRKSLKPTRLIVRLNAVSEEKPSVTKQTIF